MLFKHIYFWNQRNALIIMRPPPSKAAILQLRNYAPAKRFLGRGDYAWRALNLCYKGKPTDPQHNQGTRADDDLKTIYLDFRWRK